MICYVHCCCQQTPQNYSLLNIYRSGTLNFPFCVSVRPGRANAMTGWLCALLHCVIHRKMLAS